MSERIEGTCFADVSDRMGYIQLTPKPPPSSVSASRSVPLSQYLDPTRKHHQPLPWWLLFIDKRDTNQVGRQVKLKAESNRMLAD